MKVLLVSSSARGHAVADALSRSRSRPDIISVCPAANPGIRKLAVEQHVENIMDFDAILAIARRTKPDFAFIGPEDPIGGGIADALEEIGVPSVAPKRSLARIESSKGFTRNLLRNHGIDASPKFRVFGPGEVSKLNKYIDQELGGSFVVKYDALKGGKGVKVSGEHLRSTEDGVTYAKECIAECGSVVIEEKLVGPEFSLLSFASGTQVVDMPAVQDHKRAYEGDTGPNTGGMGTYSDADHSLPFLETADLARASEINRLTAAALLQECGTPYRGILYGGFILTKTGVKVIEYNCRFGDPEVLNLLPILTSDFADICLAILSGELTGNLVRFAPKATVCKYVCPESYPVGKDQKGALVTFPAIPADAAVYFGDITEEDDGRLRLGGSRTAGIVGIGPTISDAERIAESLCRQVRGPVRHRSDIGSADLIRQRIDQARALRSTWQRQ